MKNKPIAVIFLILILIFSLLFNVVSHELGHWAVANYYGFEPKIHLDSSNLTSAKFLVSNEPVAYTSYLGGQSTNIQDAKVALAGPLVNLLLFFIIIGVYWSIPKRKRNVYTSLVFIALAVPAIVSAIGNLIPIHGSDGWIIYNKLF